AQIAGAFLATATLLFLASNAGLDTASLGENGFSTVNAAGAFIFEAIASFIFILTILTVTSESKGNGKIAGLVIGLTLTLMILLGLNVTGL
ncbi:aquaporin, partial [Streptococcus pyogenes]